MINLMQIIKLKKSRTMRKSANLKSKVKGVWNTAGSHVWIKTDTLLPERENLNKEQLCSTLPPPAIIKFIKIISRETFACS